MIAGFNSRLCDRVGGCCGLLSGVQRHHLRGQRGGLPPLHQAAGTDHAEERSRDEEPSRDPQSEREHIDQHAGAAGRGDLTLGDPGGESRDVSQSLLLRPSQSSPHVLTHNYFLQIPQHSAKTTLTQRMIKFGEIKDCVV